ncbi:MAG: tRNA (5-methylaminomethyl-2-thiouridine)(34)-methyltransferase MnmD [Pseudomonadota bacterium]
MSDDPVQSATSSDLTWLDGDVPLSQAFDDPFFSRRDGCAEVSHVFLSGNKLPARFTGRDRFQIAELGFGTGLNFVETWRQWMDIRQPGQRLNFVSFERYPLSASDMTRALKAWPDLEELTARLVQVWAARNMAPGPWQMDDQTHLHVIIGDANETLPTWNGTADAWFLDGFSPAKNPDLWSADVMRAVADHTADEGTCATYSAAGWVRRNLEAAGFAVTKQRGHAGKRDMTVGIKTKR